MKRALLTLFILAILSPAFTHAQEAKSVPIAPCLPDGVAGMRADGVKNLVVTLEPIHQVFKRNEHETFAKLKGEQVLWLDYAKSVPFLQDGMQEWFGKTAAYKGVNLFNLGIRVEHGEEFVLSLFAADGGVIGRIEVDTYSLDNTWILFITGLEKYGLADGSRYDYHPLPHPGGGSCVFKVADADMRKGLGWQE